jgi:hypothetical protein
MSQHPYGTLFRQKLFDADQEFRDSFVGGLSNRSRSDRQHIKQEEDQNDTSYNLRFDRANIINSGFLEDHTEDEGLKMKYLSATDLNQFKTADIQPVPTSEIIEESYLRSRPIIDRPRELPRIDDRFTLVNYATRDLGDGSMGTLADFNDPDLHFPPLVEHPRNIPNIDRLDYDMVKLNQVPYTPRNFVSNESWTRGGVDSRQLDNDDE